MAEDELNELPSIDEAPWLIGTQENDDPTLDKQIFFSINNNTSHVKKIVELNGKFIHASSMGWLILRERESSTMYSLWNPITRQLIILPELLGTPYGRVPDWCVLTSPPYEDGFDNATKSVLLLIFTGVVFLCRLTTRDDYRWVKQRLKHDGLSAQFYRIAAVNGDVYAIAYMYDDKVYNHGVVDTDEENDDGVDNNEDDDVDNEDDDDVDNEEDDDDTGNTLFVRLKVISDDSSDSVVIEPLRKGSPISSIVYNMCQRDICYLVGVCGDLYAVNIISRQLDNLGCLDILKVFVWRWDMSQMEWIQVESLGDRALLLADYSCTWCWAYETHGRIEGNCIYVATYETDFIHQYRLQDNSYTFVSTHPNFDMCSCGVTWFMPHNPTRLSSLIEEAEQNIVENTKHNELREETSAEIPASLLLQLPSEIVLSITDRMHWFDCMNFRATCKKMRSKIPKPQLKANSPFPLFMFLSNTSQGICELWDPCYQNNGFITKKLPYSPSIVSTIEFCKDEWLMLRTHGGCYLQYMNPFTGETGKYPTKSLPAGLSSFAFSTCPTSPDCVTVGINCPNIYLTISLLKAGDDKWEVFKFEFEDNDVVFKSNYKSSPKYHDGAFYFLGENGNLGVFKIMDGEWEAHKGPLPDPNDDSSELNECYIAELDGQLVCVFIQAFGVGIQVYNFDITQKLWVKLKSLGDYTLFVSAASSFSVQTKDRSMRNRIYLPKRIGNEMVFYSLNTGKYHTSSSNDSFDDFCGMNSQTFCSWV